jgi:hypothetical protein
MDEMKVFCKNCHQELDETYINGHDKIPCLNCGSFLKEVNVQLEDECGFGFHDKIEIKGKMDGIKKPVIEIISGDEISRSNNKFVEKERIIDRENNRYYERIVSNDGEIIHEQDEKLTEHFGHGSAKFNAVMQDINI